jgi:hypothetical protein
MTPLYLLVLFGGLTGVSLLAFFGIYWWEYWYGNDEE